MTQESWGVGHPSPGLSRYSPSSSDLSDASGRWKSFGAKAQTLEVQMVAIRMQERTGLSDHLQSCPGKPWREAPGDPLRALLCCACRRESVRETGCECASVCMHERG